jgi:pimeloyl-ACP methyl ester carboxylesterase
MKRTVLIFGLGVLIILLVGEMASFAARPIATESEPAALFPGNSRMEIRTYPSSVEPGLTLSAEFFVPPAPRPLLLFFHGWHMSAAQSRGAGYIGQLTPDFFVVNVDMRGRGGSGGRPDASGFELLDGLDAITFARRTWPSAVDRSKGPYAFGGSGGGGNTLALAGKAPDLFAAAVSFAGMSDYALWYLRDDAGRYRDEMETWIGGTPQSNPQGYRSRGGSTVLPNVISPLLVIHGRKDPAVPFEHAQAYQREAARLKKSLIRFYFSGKGHESEEWKMSIDFLQSFQKIPRLKKKGGFVFCGFLACGPFWVIADDPARSGRVAYELDRRGRLKFLRYFGEREPEASNRFRVRLFDCSPTVVVTNGSIDLEPIAATASYRDFTWDVSVPLRMRRK